MLHVARPGYVRTKFANKGPRDINLYVAKLHVQRKPTPNYSVLKNTIILFPFKPKTIKKEEEQAGYEA